MRDERIYAGFLRQSHGMKSVWPESRVARFVHELYVLRG